MKMKNKHYVNHVDFEQKYFCQTCENLQVGDEAKLTYKNIRGNYFLTYKQHVWECKIPILPFFFDGIEHHFIQKTKLVQNVYHMVTMATPRSSQWRNLGDYLDILLGSCTQSVPWDHLWRHQRSIVTSSTGHKQRHWVEMWGSSFYRHVWAHYVVYKINECRYWRGELFMCSLERYFGVY